jgi:hypothetical protein
MAYLFVLGRAFFPTMTSLTLFLFMVILPFLFKQIYLRPKSRKLCATDTFINAVKASFFVRFILLL